MSRTVTCRPVRRVQSMIRWASSTPLRRYDCMARPAGKSIASQHRSNSVSVRSLKANCSMSKFTSTLFFAAASRIGRRPSSQCAERALEVDRVGPGAERTDLDRDVRPRDRAEVVGFQQRIRRPLGDRVGQGFDQIEIAALIGRRPPRR